MRREKSRLQSEKTVVVSELVLPTVYLSTKTCTYAVSAEILQWKENENQPEAGLAIA
jgi:hypothetical protein